MALDPSMPVLVVDDYSTMVRIIRNLLRQLGFSDVDDANDGAAALAKMHAKRYGLVISDWNMEPMSGYELLRQVRADPALGETPVRPVAAFAAPSPQSAKADHAGHHTSRGMTALGTVPAAANIAPKPAGSGVSREPSCSA
jgi:two-component system, chemotaxis family, chemotaxis protein CheY